MRGPWPTGGFCAMVKNLYIKDKQMLVFNFVFDLLWTAGGSSVNSVALTGFIEIKHIENCGFNYKISGRATDRL
jgi:hypothetical protein